MTDVPTYVLRRGQRGVPAVGPHPHDATEIDNLPKGLPFFVVAASDSRRKDQAHYICTGVNDHETIQRALDDLPAGGGAVMLLEGTYHLGEPTVTPPRQIEVPANAWLSGQGPGSVLQVEAPATRTYDVDVITIGGADARVSDLKIDGNGGAAAAAQTDVGVRIRADRALIERVEITDLDGFSGGPGISGVSGVVDAVVSDCFVHDLRGIGIRVLASGHIIRDCRVFNLLGNSPYIEAAGPEQTVVGNRIVGTTSGEGSHGIRLTTSADQATVIGNIVVDVPGRGIFTEADRSRIIANEITRPGESGIEIGDDEILVLGNMVALAQQHGIRASLGAADCAILSNYIYRCGQAADATYDGIVLDGADRNNVQGNTVRHGGGAIQHRYGIHVDGSSFSATDNLVTNNDLLNSGRTGALNDAGTGTELWGNRGASEWRDWTPGDNTGLTIGNGTSKGRYIKSGKFVFVEGTIELGTTSSVSSGCSTTLPVPANFQGNIRQHYGWASFRNDTYHDGRVRLESSTRLRFTDMVVNTTVNRIQEGGVDGTNPFTWAAGNTFWFQFAYEAA